MAQPGGDNTADQQLSPVQVLATTGPLPFTVLEQLCGARSLDADERAGLLVVDTSTGGLVALAVDPPGRTGTEVIALTKQIADALCEIDVPRLAPDATFAVAALMERAQSYNFGVVQNAARAALLKGDAATASTVLRHGLRHDPGNIHLLHLHAMALESLGLHGAATGLDTQNTGLSDPAWLGRWASNLFLSTGRPVDPARLPVVADDQHEMQAAMAWIQALEGDVNVVATAVNDIINDPRSSPQAVVWACVAGAVPAALDGRARIAQAMVVHCRSVFDELGDELSPFADLQIGLVDSLVRTRIGRLRDAAAVSEAQMAAADGPFLTAVWSFFAGIARREMGDFDHAQNYFNSGFEVIEADAFGLIGWAKSEAAVCSALLGTDRGAKDPAPVAVEGHGLFRSSLLRNASWVSAAQGDIDQAIDYLDQAIAAAHELGQNVHLALALFDLARFGEPHRASIMLTMVSEADAPILVVIAQAIRALEHDDTDLWSTSWRRLNGLGMCLQADELLYRHRHLIARSAQPWEVARLDLLGDPVLRPTPMFSETPPTPRQLTDREFEVAELCIGASSSREIAAALQISVRTVDNLLGRVYSKCSFDGRQELREWHDRHTTSQQGGFHRL